MPEFITLTESHTQKPVIIGTRHVRCVRESQTIGSTIIEFANSHKVIVTATLDQVRLALSLDD